MAKKPVAVESTDLTIIQAMKLFSTDEAALAYFEGIRWPHGPVCAHCGVCGTENAYKRAARPGVYKCASCAKDFTVMIGTVLEDSHIPIRKWMLGFYLMCASKTQISALQIQRQLELGSYRTAWHMCATASASRSPSCAPKGS